MKKIDKNPKICDFSGFTFTGPDGRTIGYDSNGVPCSKPLDIKVPNTGKPNIFVNWTPLQGDFNSNTDNLSTFNLPNIYITSNAPLSKEALNDIELIGSLSNQVNQLSQFIETYENEPWQKVVKKERVFGLKPFTIKKESHIKPHALEVEQAKVKLREVQDTIAKLSTNIGSNSQNGVLDYSDSNFNLENIKNFTIKEGNYKLVSFKNSDLAHDDNEYIKQLLYGEEGIKALKDGTATPSNMYKGSLAKQGVTIVRLDMSNCNIDGDKYSVGGFPIGQAIFDGSSNLRFLEHLNLSNNQIKDHSIYAFGNQWFCKTSPSLRTLDLSNNLLTDNGAQSLSWSFKNGNFYYLNKLDISGNKSITDVGKKDIVSGMNSGLSAGDTFVILEKQSSLEGVKSFMKKAFTYYAGEIKKYLDNQQTTNEEVSKAALKVYGTDDWAHCKKFLAEGGFAVGLGVTSKVSHSILMKVVPDPYSKAVVFGGLVIEASIESMGSIDWKDAGYCIAAINGLFGSNQDDPLLPDNSIGFVGENGVVDEIL